MAAALFTTACGGFDAPTAESARTFSGTVSGYDGPNAELRATARLFDGTFGSTVVVGQGDLGTDDTFTFAFDAHVDPALLVDFRDTGTFCSGAQVTGAANGGTVISLEVRDGAGTRLGSIGLASSAATLDAAVAGNQTAGVATARLYVDADVRVSGACSDGSASYDLSLDAGWNVVEIRASGNALAVTTASPASSGQSWWFRPAVSSAISLQTRPASGQGSVLPWLP